MPRTAPPKNPPIVAFQLSSFSRRFAAATLVNSKAPPIAAVFSLVPCSSDMIHFPGAEPKTATVPPVRVKMPSAPTFCLTREFCIAEAKRPAPAVIIVTVMVRLMASFGSYTVSSEAMMTHNSAGPR